MPGQAGLIAHGQTGPDAIALRRIFVVVDNLNFAEELKTQLSYFGYSVIVFNTLKAFRVGLQHNPDAIVLMDISFPEDRLGGVKLMNEIQQARDAPLPVIFLSTHDEFTMRLEAARAGGIAYLVKPVNIGALIDKLDSLTSTKPLAPYRVMIVDDSLALTAYHTTVLEQAGMAVKAVNNPL